MIRQINLYKTIIVGYSLIFFGAILITFPFFYPCGVTTKFLIQTIGTALVPAGLISLINDYLLKKDFSKELNEQLDDFITKNLDKILEQQIVRAHVYESNPTSEIASTFLFAKENIFLLNNWIPDFDGLRVGLKSVIAKKIQVRILLMNPDSKFASIRAREIGLVNENELSALMRVEIHNIIEFFEKNNASNYLQIRLFDGMPAMPVYATEDVMYIGWFFRAKRAVSCPVIRVGNRLSPLYKEAAYTFENLWNDQNTLPHYPPPP